MNASPQLSVLLPVYNAEPYLDEAIRSIRSQTFTDFEFVIVNDGSTDGSMETIQRHAIEDPRIVVLDRPNGGIASALNGGLAVCRGEFIARMDGDDVSIGCRLAEQLAYIKKRSLDVVGSSATAFGASRRPHKIRVALREAGIYTAATLGTPFVHPTTFLSKRLLLSVGGWPDSPIEDMALWHRLLAAGARCANLPKSLLLYRVHDANYTRFSSKQVEVAEGLCWEFVRDVLQAPVGRQVFGSILRMMMGQGHAEPPDFLHFVEVVADTVQRRLGRQSPRERDEVLKEAVSWSISLSRESFRTGALKAARSHEAVSAQLISRMSLCSTARHVSAYERRRSIVARCWRGYR